MAAKQPRKTLWSRTGGLTVSIYYVCALVPRMTQTNWHGIKLQYRQHVGDLTVRRCEQFRYPTALESSSTIVGLSRTVS